MSLYLKNVIVVVESFQRCLQHQLLWQGVPAIQDDVALHGAPAGVHSVVA